jgi:DNA-binding CsgD family transcriptional regulator
VTDSYTESEMSALRRPGLSERETKCLQLAAEGFTSDEVAKETGIAPGTVKNLWKSASTKLGSDNLKQSIAMAMRRGLIK